MKLVIVTPENIVTVSENFVVPRVGERVISEPFGVQTHYVVTKVLHDYVKETITVTTRTE